MDRTIPNVQLQLEQSPWDVGFWCCKIRALATFHHWDWRWSWPCLWHASQLMTDVCIVGVKLLHQVWWHKMDSTWEPCTQGGCWKEKQNQQGSCQLVQGDSTDVPDKVSANDMSLSGGTEMERQPAWMTMWRWLGREPYSVSQCWHFQAFNSINKKVIPQTTDKHQPH